ncbi:nucleotidyltransferase family protein [Paenibacillus sedimenti]|uniref:NTP transferase domain-containing protein n=1 Tax=Paenibacillus sedimenti TaxID=2770274 RepID=A0A926KSM3_9BACL|nr:nucleotidyltransferase family protein [Paenibacillus sedimenti]MBD0383359.1 NTP transferase domain-containing protein [Paenibacillus sedimenti]
MMKSNDWIRSIESVKSKKSRQTGLVGVYLAAGSSKRMGMAKLSLELADGVRLGGIALLQALRSDLDYIVIVAKDGHALDWLPEEAYPHLLSGRCRIAVCRDAKLGMALSLRTGIQAAEALGADSILVMLADQPFVTDGMLTGLVEAFRQGADFDYIASGDAGTPKPPVVLGRSMWSDALALEGDAGARLLFRMPKFRGRVIQESNELHFMDVDTPKCFEQAKKVFRNKMM